MKFLSSDLKDFENRTLYVIGNGFDMFHKIPSSYMHFYHWLKSKGKDDFILKMEKYFPSMKNGESLLWKDFERALGQYDVNSIFEDAVKGLNRIEDEKTKYVANEALKPIIEQIKPLIKEWVKQIELSKISPLLCLPNDSWYITFNYTLTLEKVYCIPSERICHIHNSINDESIIVGHKNLVDGEKYEKEEIDWYEECAKKSIVEIMNQMVKIPFNNRNNHEVFWRKIKGLDRIVVLGHSMSEIDEDYFGYIKSAANKDAHWHISKFLPSDEEQIAKCLEKRKIENMNRWIFNL